MPAEFVIDTEWEGSDHGLSEDRATAAQLRISFGDFIATRVESDWSGSVHEKVRVSAYPLAVWLAVNWWRLRWESIPLWGRPPTSWRMAHEMSAAGHGFLWPRLSFSSDGETMDAHCRASQEKSAEPVRYLSNFKATFPAEAFVEAVDEFIERVLARLNVRDIQETDLHKVWADVLEERRDPRQTLWRKLEARLGFDPDEAPEHIVADLQDLASEAGEAALGEIAPALSNRDLAKSLAETIDAARTGGTPGSVSGLGKLGTLRPEEGVPPWTRGRLLARDARSALGLSDERVQDKQLSDLLRIPVDVFSGDDLPQQRAPFGLAVREAFRSELSIHFRMRNRPGIRFEAARFLVDHITAPTEDRWLPVTNAKTARQKMQRAFAAEFLCPINALEAYLEGDFSDESIEDAAMHFGVSVLTAKSHLANHGLISSDMVVV